MSGYCAESYCRELSFEKRHHQRRRGHEEYYRKRRGDEIKPYRKQVRPERYTCGNIPMEKFAAVQEQIGARAKRKRQTEHVSKTFVEEISWDNPIVSTETDRTQERREISWSEPKPEEE